MAQKISKFNPLVLPFENDDYQDFLDFEGMFSNFHFSKVTDGLLKVYPELEKPLHVYFQGPYNNLNYARLSLITIKEYLYLLNEFPDVFYRYEFAFEKLKKKYNSLDRVVNNSEYRLESFYRGVFKFLEESEWNNNLNSHNLSFINYFSKNSSAENIYKKEALSNMREVLLSESSTTKLHKSITNPHDMRDFGEKSWNLFKELLTVWPEVSYSSFKSDLLNFRNEVSDFRKINNKSIYKILMPDYYDLLLTERIDVEYLREPLAFFKEQHHDPWIEYKIKKYF